MRRPLKTTLFLSLGLLLLFSLASLAGPGMILGSVGDGGGAHVDLVVRKVVVTPIRARSGEPVSIEVVWMYWGDLSNNYYESTSANVLANGKLVAKKPFDYEFGARLGDEYRHTFVWDTVGMAPGRYRIRAEVPLRLDATPYDNFLDVKEPLVLFPAGAAFPAGEGSGVAENPFWMDRNRPANPSRETKTGPP
jgi:hypothetical protein